MGQIGPDPQCPGFSFSRCPAQMSREQGHDVCVVETRSDLVGQAGPAHAATTRNSSADDALVFQSAEMEAGRGDVYLQCVGDMLHIDRTTRCAKQAQDPLPLLPDRPARGSGLSVSPVNSVVVQSNSLMSAGMTDINRPTTHGFAIVMQSDPGLR